MIYFSLFLVPVLQAIQGQFSLAGTTLHFKEDVHIEHLYVITLYLVIIARIQLSSSLQPTSLKKNL